MDPHHTKAHWQLALIKGFEGDFDGSLADLKRLNQQNPNDLDILNDLGMTYNMLGYPDEACETFARILHINPDHENARRQSIRTTRTLAANWRTANEFSPCAPSDDPGRTGSFSCFCRPGS